MEDVVLVCVICIVGSISLLLLEFFTETDDANDIGEGW